jgi:hypothetical protein
MPPALAAPTIIQAPPPGQSEAVNAPGPEIIEGPPERQCFVRARLFHGLVQTPCELVAKEIRP